MSDHPAIPPDDETRKLKVADPEDASLPHIGLVGDTYTILVSGADTNGKYCLIDMHVPPGGGPPPHRHDFEEFFHVLDGEVEFMFRDAHTTEQAGRTVAIPANAPHAFKNSSNAPARMLCMCAPAGQEEFFLQVGARVNSRTAPAPKPDKEAQAAQKKKVLELAPQYRTEMLKP